MASELHFLRSLVPFYAITRCQSWATRVRVNVLRCRWTKLGEVEAEVGRTEALYLAVTEEGRAAGEESASLTSLRTKLEREMVQIGEESLKTDRLAMDGCYYI